MDELLTNKSLNFATPINNRSYGIVGANLIREFDKRKINTAAFVIPANSKPDVSYNELLGDSIQLAAKNSLSFNIESPSLRLWHQFDVAPRLSRGKHVAYTIFELDKFTQQEKSQIESVDHLAVCSQWAKDIVLRETNQKHVAVIPLGVDPTIFKPDPLIHSSSTYRFLNIGKTEFRKGHDILVDVFNNAFTEKDDVELLISWENPFLKPEEKREWESMYKYSKLKDKIKFVPWLKTHQELANLMNFVDCGIFPSRAEGFNLPALEMMACNKSIIVTNYSAHTEFCNEANSFLINGDETEPAFDGKWFFNQGNWMAMGEDQLNQLVDSMRMCYNKQIKSNSQGVDMARVLTWERTTSLLEAILY